MSEDSLQLSWTWETGASLSFQGRGAASEGCSNHTSVHPVHQHTTQSKGFTCPSLGCLPQRASLLGTQAEYCHPKVPSHVPSVNPALVVFDPCHLLTETLRHREGRSLLKDMDRRAEALSRQAGTHPALLPTTQPSLAPTRL